MHGTLTLLRHSLGRLRGLVAAMAFVVALFQVLLVRVAGTLQESSGFGGLAAFVPPFVRQMAGEALFTFMSFPGIVCLGYFHPMIIAALCGMVIAAATEPAAEIETLAESLANVSSSIDRKGKVLGIGLSVSQKVVAGHGGMIFCKSEPGGGAQFSIWLPLDV